MIKIVQHAPIHKIALSALFVAVQFLLLIYGCSLRTSFVCQIYASMICQKNSVWLNWKKIL